MTEVEQLQTSVVGMAKIVWPAHKVQALEASLAKCDNFRAKYRLLKTIIIAPIPVITVANSRLRPSA